jgi:polar amino acid transport system substrate-binding protein
MGTEPGFKPFEYLEGTTVVGFDIDLAREIASDNGKTLRIEQMAFDGLLPALQSGRIDMVIAGMTITPDRARNVDFSDSYYSAAQKIIIPIQGSSIKNGDDLVGKRIGVQLGTTGDILARNIQGARVDQLPAVASLFVEINAGRVDAIILDDGPARQYLTQNPKLTMLPDRLSNEDYAIAVKKGNTTLLRQINDSLLKMKQNGQYDNLIKKYFGEVVR